VGKKKETKSALARETDKLKGTRKVYILRKCRTYLGEKGADFGRKKGGCEERSAGSVAESFPVSGKKGGN